MKKYQLRNTIIDLLLRIEKNKSFSHLLIDNEIKAQKMDSKDEGLLTEIVYGTVQRKLTLDYYLQNFIKPNQKIQSWVKILLRMSLYQMIYLDRIPDHAIIHEAVEMAKQRGHKGTASFVNGVLRNIQRKGIPRTDSIENDVKRLAVQTSHPEWLIERWLHHYGYKVTKEMCKANLNKKPLSIRIQPMKISREEAMRTLQELGFQVRPSLFSEQGIIVDQGNILKTDLFKKGYVTVQDQSSMLVSEMLKVQPSMDVLDTCSAPGGKVTHIAEKMQNSGSVYAYDLHKNKVKLINKKASDLHLTNINAQQADARNLRNIHADESFDRILVDAPCSGFGVIRGKPDIKYNKQEKDVHQLAAIQADILDHVAPLLKKDGLLIYSTCTVDVEENENVVKNFLEKHKDFEVDASFIEDLPKDIKKSPGITKTGIQLFPHTFQTDGFFFVRLIRKGSYSTLNAKK
ncbi:16S rRNA (cytosine(967)-C(5))-methyltransferase RsmB [Virgibacillus alimentarius]|uniref:16S rRNA (cytosine(967)-C(5))-methyltransferase RsmB n=1 Tax=Virgibacillus alimentarius TaxID=698769 RepID=UPI000493A052|nr:MULTISPECIES: 16S rRNA (cytosine(967)-C(5))-methyltransferase RsmB [Virgibacillus]HLR66096.1 16S rRNA (cytosine(967)-C(5))-methyltransferase RsmB [Virgibacillus sp.]